MEIEIYNLIGKIVIWLSAGYIIFKLLSSILISVINWLGEKGIFLWKFVEFIYYRKEFKEWVKDKERIKDN